jgi:hypothetical protein
MTFPRQSVDDLREILERMTGTLLASAAATPNGRAASELRRAVGDLMADLGVSVRDGSFTAALLKCFTEATEAGINLLWMDKLIRGLLAEEPDSPLTSGAVQVSVVFALSQESVIISRMTFTNREAIDEMMVRMRSLFDAAKDMAADGMDSICYYSLSELAAALTQHLVKTAQPLPRIVEYLLPSPMPALTISNLIYGDGGRSEEIIATNRVVHPAFVRSDVRALSA